MEITGSTLTPETLKTVPAAVTLFTYKEIQRMGLDTLDELMNLVPGFQSYTTSATSQSRYISSRGRRINNAGAEILIMVDGQRFDDPRSSGSTIATPKIPLFNIERVEFIRGPGTTIYGSNAMQGMINIVTRSDVNEVQVSYGSFNRRQVNFLCSYTEGDVWLDVFGHFEDDNGDDYKVQDSFSANRIETSDPRESADLNVKLQWRTTRVNLQYSQFKVEQFYELGNISNDFNQRKARFAALSLQQDFSWLTVQSNIWLSYHRTDFETSAQLTAPGALFVASGGASNDPLLLTADFGNSTEIRTKWHNDWQINKQNRVQFGLELRHLDIPETVGENNFDLGDLSSQSYPIRFYGDMQATTPLEAESSRDIVGIYAQHQYQLFTTTELTLGLRYDDFSSIGGQLSPRFGLVQRVTEHQNVKLLYGKAFRAPTENEMNLLNNPVALGNPDLKSETVQSWDLIWVGQWLYTSINFGYFENHYKDSIEQILVNGVVQYTNVDPDPVKGVEIEVIQELDEHWQLRAAYTHFTEKPASTFRETDQLASFMVNYQQDRWNSNIIATYAGEREMPISSDNSNLIKLDPYWQVFAKVLYKIDTNWQGFAQVKNLLDEGFETPASNAALVEGVPNRGREILVGLTWTM
jgi:outer membrane receptor protein involved in Fe transport